MKIIPVIDLLGGNVVHGKSGQRDLYQPIQSKLAEGASPDSIAQAFSELGFTECYVADLDAIAGKEPDWQAYTQIANQGLELWIDAGLRSVEIAQHLFDYCERTQLSIHVIVALETLPDIFHLNEFQRIFTSANIVFSLDIKNSQPINSIAEWKNFSAYQIAEEIVHLDINQLIVLDLDQVGTGHGIATAETCLQIRKSFPQLEIISGGGVRNLADLKRLAKAGCDAALLATAIHKKKITRKHIDLIAEYYPTIFK